MLTTDLSLVYSNIRKMQSKTRISMTITTINKTIIINKSRLKIIRMLGKEIMASSAMIHLNRCINGKMVKVLAINFSITEADRLVWAEHDVNLFHQRERTPDRIMVAHMEVAVVSILANLSNSMSWLKA